MWQLMDAWAELVATDKDVVTAPAVAVSSGATDFEREKLAFEERRFAAELEQRRADAAAAERHEAAAAAAAAEAIERREAVAAEATERREAADRDERRERAAAAAAEVAERRERAAAAAAESAERMAIAQLNAAMEANRIASETNEKFRDREGRVSAQLKRFGDALRASLTKMSDQPIDLIIFLDSADRLFWSWKFRARFASF